MPKDRDRKIQEALDRAEFAQQAALNSLTTAQVLGSILELVIATLRAKAILTPEDLRQIFFGAAAEVDVLQPSNDHQRGAQEHMRQIVVNIAKSFHVEVPPPGWQRPLRWWKLRNERIRFGFDDLTRQR